MIQDQKTSRWSLTRFALSSIVILGVLVVVLGSLFYLDSRKTYQGEPVSLTIGMPALETNALVYIAADRGYFEAFPPILRLGLMEFRSVYLSPALRFGFKGCRRIPDSYFPLQ